MVDLTNAPYYDTTEAEIDKGYTQILFTSGKAVQSRELTSIGSYAREHTKKIANLLYKSGTIISGCTIVSTDMENGTITMSPGSVFVDGEVFDIVFEKPEGPFGETVAVNTDLVSKTIPINTVGEETIYVEIVSDVKDSVSDPDLLDPAEGYDNYHEAGASRLRKIARFISTAHPDYNNTQFMSNPRIPIYSLMDGQVVSNKTSGAKNNVTEDKPAESSAIDVMDVLSQRNYETLGNYLVEGFDVSPIECDDGTKIGLLVEPGVAYINGVRREQASSKKIYIKKNLLTTTTYNEEHTIINGTKEYKLNGSPVVSAIVRAPIKNREQLAYTSANQRGTIRANGYPVYRIVRVYTNGNPGTTYVPDVDYRLQGNDIVWLSTGNHPTSTYNVEYLYKPMLSSSQYEIFRRGAKELQLNLSVNSLGLAEIPAQYLNPSIISIQDAANPGVELRKNSVWYQQGNKLKIATTSNAVLPIEMTRSAEDFDTLPFFNGEVESAKYFSEDGEFSYSKNLNAPDQLYDFTHDIARNAIVWDGNNTPPTGETYVVNIRIPLDASTDIKNVIVKFVYEVESDLYTSRVYNSWIRFLDDSIEAIDDKDSFNIDTTIARTRRDAVCLDRDGNIKVLHGTAIGSNGIYETKENDSYLKIADVIIKPTTAKSVAIYTSDNYRMRMQDLRNMYNKVKDIEYNISLTQLETYAEGKATDYSLRGIIAEAFNGLGVFDTSATYLYADNGSQLAIPNVAESRLYPGFKRYSGYLSIDDENTTAGRKGDMFVLSNSNKEVLWLEQPYGTTTRSLSEGHNEYLIFPKLEISPDSDYFVSGSLGDNSDDDEYLYIPNEFTTYSIATYDTYDHITIPLKSGAFNNGTGTVEFYVKFPSLMPEPFMAIGNVYVSYSQNVLSIVSPNATAKYKVGNITNRWTHLAFVFERNKFRNLVVDGTVFDGPSLVVGIDVSAASSIILRNGANNPNPATNRTGLVMPGDTARLTFSTIRVYNAARSANDISTYMLADIPADTATLIGNYNSRNDNDSAIIINNVVGLDLAEDAYGHFTTNTINLTDLTAGTSNENVTHIVNTVDLTLGSIKPEDVTTSTSKSKTSTSTALSTKTLKNVYNGRGQLYSATYQDTRTTTKTTTTTITENSTYYTKDMQTKVEEYGNFITNISGVLYLRRIQITVKGTGLLPNTDPIEITFNGQKVNLYALSSGGKGTKSGTTGCWKADANGEFICRFIIPEGIPIGNREVEMIIPGGPNTKTAFWGAGLITDKTKLEVQTDTISWKENKSSRTYTKTNVSTTSNTSSRYVCYITCPLAQTIYVNDPSLCWSLLKDTTDYSDVYATSVDLFIRDFNNTTKFFVGFLELSDSGYPKSNLDRWVSDIKYFYGSDLRENGGKFEYGTARTHIVFDEPIKLKGGKGYALITGSTDPTARVWVAKIGQTEPTINNIVGTTIRTTPDKGMLLSSPNSNTWVAYIDEDLKYSLYIKDYSSSGALESVPASNSLIATNTDGYSSTVQYNEILFSDVSNGNITAPNFFRYDVMYNNSTDNTGYITFEYALKSNGSYSGWTEFNPGATVQINKASDGLRIRAKIISFNKYSTPILDGRAAITLGQYNLPAYYVSRTATAGNYNRVDAYIDRFYDDNLYNIEYKYSPDAGYTWREFQLKDVTPIYTDSDEYLTQQYQYQYYGELTLGKPIILNGDGDFTMINADTSKPLGRYTAGHKYDVAYCLKDAYGREGPLSDAVQFTAVAGRVPHVKLQFDPNAVGYAVYIRDVTADESFHLWYDSTITSEVKVHLDNNTMTVRIGPEGRLFPNNGVLLIDTEYMAYTTKTKIDDSTWELGNITRGYTHKGNYSNRAPHEVGRIVYLADQLLLNRGNITGTVPDLWRFGNFSINVDAKTKEYIYLFEEDLYDRGLDYLASDTSTYSSSYPASFESTRASFKIKFARLDGGNNLDFDAPVPTCGRAILNTYYEAF